MLFGSKTLRLIPFFERNFHFLDQMVLFLDLDCQNLASLDFGNCPISKKDHLISELKISLSEMKLRPRVFLPQSKSIPEAQNMYSLSMKLCCFSNDVFPVSLIFTNLMIFIQLRNTSIPRKWRICKLRI